MSSAELHRFQAWFAEALVRDGPDDPAASPAELSSIVAGGSLSPAGRLRVYQEAFWIRMHENLEEDYPEVRRLMRPEPFRRVVRRFITQHPQPHPSLLRLGEAFPLFLGRARPERPELAEVARIEWAKIEVRHAEASQSALIAPPALPPEVLLGIRLMPSPTSRLLELTHRIGTWLGMPATARAEVGVEPGPETVVVVRRDFVVHVEPVPPPFDRVLVTLHAGGTLAEAVAVLESVEVEPAAVTAAFADFLAKGYFSGFEI